MTRGRNPSACTSAFNCSGRDFLFLVLQLRVASCCLLSENLSHKLNQLQWLAQSKQLENQQEGKLLANSWPPKAQEDILPRLEASRNLTATDLGQLRSVKFANTKSRQIC